MGGVQDLVDPNDYSKIVPLYPSWLNETLRTLAQAVLSKASNAMVWVGGPARFWGRLRAWDNYMELARNELRQAGLQVVPKETVDWVMDQLRLARDGISISNIDEHKVIFAQSIAACVRAAATDPTWGRDAPVDISTAFDFTGGASAQVAGSTDPGAATAAAALLGGARERSRSPPQRVNPFAAYGYNPA